MPAEYTLETLPKPLNPKVEIRQIPQVKRAVMQFSGFYNSQKVAEKTLELEQWMQSMNLVPVGAPKFARYNPPWTLPFMRRNEIMIDVRD
jgi:DNA gyrase inhibitor GyrI